MADGDRTDDQAGLVAYLQSIGFSDAHIAANDGALLSLASRRVLFGDEKRLTLAEVAAAAGCSESLAQSVRRAAGLPDPGDAAVYSPLLIDVMQAFAVGVSVLGEEETLQFTRVLGNATAGLAEAALATFASNRQATLREGGASLADLAQAGAEATTALLAVAPVVDVLLRMHFEYALSGRFAGEDPSPTITLAVGFVDLVESTRLTLSLTGKQLSAALTDFDRDASDAVVAAGGRVVKRIGDAVMFVTSDAAGACRAATTILELVAAHPDLVAARAAVAWGAVLPRDGDYFGPSVNVAARAVPIAEPGTIVVTREVREALSTDDWDICDLAAPALKGFDEPVELFAVTALR